MSYNISPSRSFVEPPCSDSSVPQCADDHQNQNWEDDDTRNDWDDHHFWRHCEQRNNIDGLVLLSMSLKLLTYKVIL